MTLQMEQHLAGVNVFAVCVWGGGDCTGAVMVSEEKYRGKKLVSI